MKIDELDVSIIGLLAEDGKRQYNDMADILKVSEGTVRNRVKRLLESGYLKIAGLTNPNMDTEKHYMFLAVEVAANRDCEIVAESINMLSDVIAVSVVAGKPDLIVEIHIETHKLRDFLRNELGRIDSVTSVDTMMVLKSYSKWI